MADGREQLKAMIGQKSGPSDWLMVDQARVNAFAEATEDRQWIHLDVEAAKAGPFGHTIAHGYLTLSLLPHLAGGLLPVVDGIAGAINYGTNKVRFPTSLPVGTRVRAHGTLVDVADHALGVMLTQKVEIEGEGMDKPVCVAEALMLLFF